MITNKVEKIDSKKCKRIPHLMCILVSTTTNFSATFTLQEKVKISAKTWNRTFLIFSQITFMDVP